MKVTLSILLWMTASIQLWSQCEESLQIAEKTFGTNFIAEPQYVQGMISRDDSLSFTSLWLSENTYRIATSATEKERIKFIVFDKNNNIIFDSSEFNSPADWDFFVEQSLEVRCVVRCERTEPICVTVLTGFKK